MVFISEQLQQHVRQYSLLQVEFLQPNIITTAQTLYVIECLGMLHF